MGTDWGTEIREGSPPCLAHLGRGCDSDGVFAPCGCSQESLLRMFKEAREQLGGGSGGVLKAPPHPQVCVVLRMSSVQTLLMLGPSKWSEQWRTCSCAIARRSARAHPSHLIPSQPGPSEPSRCRAPLAFARTERLPIQMNSTP
eukprot:62319-Chlamydomonas_euryale.AAC.2